jgi:hypothetical protein
MSPPNRRALVRSVVVLSDWREGTLDVVVSAAPESDDETSHWEGMSGAAVWAAADHVIGVIATLHLGDGLAPAGGDSHRPGA